MILWARCPEHTAASQGDLEVSWCVYRSFDLRLSLRLATQQLTPRWLWEQKASGSSLRTGSYFVERNDKAKMLFLTTAKKTTWMLFWMCRIVIVPNNPCLLLWGYEIFLCPICAWLSLISHLLQFLCFGPAPPFSGVPLPTPVFWLYLTRDFASPPCIWTRRRCFYVLHNFTSASNRFLHVLALTILLLLVHAPVRRTNFSIADCKWEPVNSYWGFILLF